MSAAAPVPCALDGAKARGAGSGNSRDRLPLGVYYCTVSVIVPDAEVAADVPDIVNV